MNRQKRAEIAQETLTILRDGGYSWVAHEEDREPSHVPIGPLLQAACANTVLHPETERLAIPKIAEPPRQTVVFVCNETTFGCARRLSRTTLPQASHCHLGALNFASARNPGGGFQRGALAQEESLAITSGLFACLTTDAAKPFYESHQPPKRGRNNAKKASSSTSSMRLYSSQVIFSPHVPVFREDQVDEHGTLPLLGQPYTCSILTSCAVNHCTSGARVSISKKQQQRRRTVPVSDDDRPKAVAMMQSRAHRVLQVAAYHGINILILGAWGCGVFGNDPSDIALAFDRALRQPDVAGRFCQVYFAIPCRRRPEADAKFQAFAKRFPVMNVTEK